MEASALVVAEADDRGVTRPVRLRSETPLLLRQTPTYDGSLELHLVGGAAGPIGGDRLRLHLEVRAGAVLTVRGVAASIALPGRDGTESLVTVTAAVGAGGTLRWLPEQLVAAYGCRHRSVSTVELEAGATLVWRDELICGRHGEDPGDASVHTAVEYAGRPLLRQTVSVGPGADGWAGAAVLSGAKATGSLVRVDPSGVVATAAVLGPTAVQVPLAGPGSLITATAPDALTLRRLLTP